MKNITVIIHTFNEEKNIKDCIQSAKLLTRNIILIDMKSKDKTVDLAKEMGAKIYSFPFSYYVEPAREFGIKKAKTDWIFILDADERINEGLSQEISARTKNSSSTFYKVSRKNFFGKKKWLKHGGWWPDYQVRLINRGFFVSWPKKIHSTPKIKGKLGFLNNSLDHYSHGNLKQMVNKTLVFEDIESDLLLQANKNSSLLIFFRKFLGEFYRRLFRQLGFLDGVAGIIESIYQSFSKTITYLFLYEKKLKTKKGCSL